MQLSSTQAPACAPFRRAVAGRSPCFAARPQAAARCTADAAPENPKQPTRRAALQAAAAVVAAVVTSRPGAALADAPNGPQNMGAMTNTDGEKLLVNPEQEKELEDKPRIKTDSGLEYQDVVVGKGPTPPVGIQIVVNYVAKTPNGKIFDNSLIKGAPYYIRVGSGAVVAGLDEALLSMNTGSVRRLYIPGELAFPKGLASAPGRPKVPPKSPVVFDVELVYIPGISDDLEFDE